MDSLDFWYLFLGLVWFILFLCLAIDFSYDLVNLLIKNIGYDLLNYDYDISYGLLIYRFIINRWFIDLWLVAYDLAFGPRYLGLNLNM